MAHAVATDELSNKGKLIVELQNVTCFRTRQRKREKCKATKRKKAFSAVSSIVSKD